MSAKGILVVISASSGAGKSTIIGKLLSDHHDYYYSVSTTTRPKRPSETEGKDYCFIDEDSFRTLIKENGFIEWEEVHGDLYGTPKKEIDDRIINGEIVILDIDVNGGLNIKDEYKENAVLIFIKPPSREVLRERLVNRKTETEEQIEIRLKRYDLEIQKAPLYNYRVVNHTVDKAVKEVHEIIQNRKGELSHDQTNSS